MAFSIRQIYARQIAFLSIGLFLLLIISIGMAFFHEARVRVLHELGTQANMVATSIAQTPTITAEDEKKRLNHVFLNPAIQLACLKSDSGLIELHNQEGSTEDAELSCATVMQAPPVWDYLSVKAVMTDDTLPKPLGEVVLVAHSPSYIAMVIRAGIIAGLLSLIFSGLCWLLAERLERVVLRPIRQIASTAQRVTLYKDYSLRVVPGALNVVPQEIELLTDSFNAMLHEIEDRDGRLTRKGEELERSQREAVTANQAKSQFLANVSHELRTPLNAIIGFSTMLQQEQFGPLGHPKYTEYSRDINDSGRHLLDVINDILDLSRAESGTLSVTFEALNIYKIIEKTLNIIANQAHERKIDIYTDLPDKLPKIYADRVRLVQILLNLLSNAIKFSKEGGKVILRVRAEAAKQGVHYFTIEVVDEGIGMSQADVVKAFSTFNQADAGLNRRYEGAGLGLPLTKRLVELHHGKIKVESEVGRGTTVIIRLTSDPAQLA